MLRMFAHRRYIRLSGISLVLMLYARIAYAVCEAHITNMSVSDPPTAQRAFVQSASMTTMRR